MKEMLKRQCSFLGYKREGGIEYPSTGKVDGKEIEVDEDRHFSVG